MEEWGPHDRNTGKSTKRRQEKQSCHSSVQEAGTAISTGMVGEAEMGPREEPGKI